MKNKKIDLQLEKSKIRKEILEKRNNLSNEEVEKKSDLIIKNLEKFVRNAENMMIPKDDKQQIDYPECPVLYLILCFKEIRNQHIEVRHEDNQ